MLMRIRNVSGISKILTLNLPICCQYQIHMTERVFLLCRHVTAVIGYTQCQSPRVVFGSKMKTFVGPLGFGSAPHFASHINVLAVFWSMLVAYTVSCKLSTSKHARHNVINDLIARAVTLVDIPCVKEPRGLSRSDGKRPDGMTLIPLKAGKYAL